MHRHHFPSPQRWARGAMAVWLCVLLVSWLSPWMHAHAQHMAATGALQVAWADVVCVAEDEAHAQHRPAPHDHREEDAAVLAHDGDRTEAVHAVHGLDCPLCVPAWAPLQGNAVKAASAALPASGCVAALPAAWVWQVCAPLPARGPPWA